jgi:hypothetical protein
MESSTSHPSTNTLRQDPSISPHDHFSQPPHQQISPDYSNPFDQTLNSSMSNLPPSLQHRNSQGSSRLPDDIWLAPPLDGDSGIGLSGVGDNRLWFGGSGSGSGMNTNTFNLGDLNNTSESLSHLFPSPSPFDPPDGGKTSADSQTSTTTVWA